MNNDYTDISVVQDKSGSMAGLRDDTIGGFNTFLKEQQAVKGKCTMTLCQFDTSFNFIYRGEDIQKVKPLDHETYMPGGNTALFDAIAKTITETGQRLETMPEAERPARVIIAVLTDGQENASLEFPRQHGGKKKVCDMITHQEKTYNWQFVFIGANQDAFDAGEGLGVKGGNIISAAANAKGTESSYKHLSSNVRAYRSADPANVDAMSFSADQRKEQKDAGAAADKMNTP